MSIESFYAVLMLFVVSKGKVVVIILPVSSNSPLSIGFYLMMVLSAAIDESCSLR